MMIDKNGFSTLNHESVVSEIFSTNSNLATVSREGLTYDMASVTFGKTAGTVFLKSQSKGYNFKEEHKSMFGGSKKIEK